MPVRGVVPAVLRDGATEAAAGEATLRGVAGSDRAGAAVSVRVLGLAERGASQEAVLLVAWYGGS